MCKVNIILYKINIHKKEYNMKLSQINPFIRYAIHLDLNAFSEIEQVIALDARLFYVVEGYGKIKVNSDLYEMSENSLLIVNSGIPYHILTPESSIKYIQINFDFTQKSASCFQPVTPVAIENFSKEMLLDFIEFEDSFLLSNVLYIKKIDGIYNKLSAIINEYSQKLLYYNQKAGHILAECIFDCLRHTELGDISSENIIQNEILMYIHTHYNEKLTNDSIAKIFGYHPNYVSALIKQMTGLPLHKYIIQARLEKAANLLVNSKLSVNEIAVLSGFYDTAYFSGYFKKHFGITPSKYRNI